MVVFRKSPSTHVCNGVTLHMGAQFIPDKTYLAMKDDPGFKAQIDSDLESVLIDVEQIDEKSTSKVKPLPKSSMAETVRFQDEKKAISLIKMIVDSKDLDDIIKLDNRDRVVDEAKKQKGNRETLLSGMGIQSFKGDVSKLSLGIHG
jgi:hypothetical protein